MQYTVDRDDAGVIQNTECFLLDMDGTIYLGGEWIDGAREFLSRVTESGRRWLFMTNNSSRSVDAYVKKLADMGLAATPDDILSSSKAALDVLKREYAGKSVCLLGNSVLAAEFAAAGIDLRFSANADICLAAYDTELKYEKMCVFCNAVRSGKPYLATHPDFNCPVKGGFEPDLGSFMALIEASTGRKADRIIGKPYRDFADYAVACAGVPRERITVVGDRLYTDVKTGTANGLGSVLVLSGEATLQDLYEGDVHPSAVFTSLKEMTPYL